MSRTIAKELNNLKNGERQSCPICNPPDPKKYISADRLWQWSQCNPGEQVFRDRSPRS